ncbi:hypothetical protein KEM55_001164, partial [Ascosphaera atra]
MAIPISKPAIVEVAPPNVGSTVPAYVRSEILLDTSRLGDNIREEWEALRTDDVVFLLAVRPEMPATALLTKTTSEVGLLNVRAAEIVQVLDERGRPIRETAVDQTMGFKRRNRTLRLIVNIDASSYKSDLDNLKKGMPDVYSQINVVARRKGRENNFKSILETLQKLTATTPNLPSWLQDVFLGYGDPSSAHADKVRSVDYRDTFLDWDHLVKSFPDYSLEPTGEAASSGPPYVLDLAEEKVE